MSEIDKKLHQALSILIDLGLPKAQQNERTALCLLALLDMKPANTWQEAQSPLMGITPIMDWSKEYYNKDYAPNTRETFRRQSIHQFVQAGICLYNPDQPERPVNSPHAVYQIEPHLLKLIKEYESGNFKNLLSQYLETRNTLTEKYAKERDMQMIPVKFDGQEIKLSSGKHSKLIKDIIEDFAPRYTPNGKVVYIGDTGNKNDFLDKELLKNLRLSLDNHGKFPDVIIHYTEKNWLLLIESITSHGAVDSKRYEELSELFKDSKAGLVFVSAFPDRKTFLKYLENIAWETEVWIADAPTHVIHFNGTRFLGPYK
jgi:hypothetical protein